MQVFDKKGDFTGVTVLIADDGDISRKMLKAQLGKVFNIIEAKSGLEVMDILKSPKCDIACIVLDILMPVMDGIKVLEFMRENGLDQQIPVIAVTGISDVNGKLACYEAGAADFIEKPYDQRILLNRVKHYIDLYAKIREAETRAGAAADAPAARNLAVLDSLPQAVFVFDNATLRINYCNAAFTLIPGMAAQPVGKPLAEVFHPTEYAAILSAVSNLLTAKVQTPVSVQAGGMTLSLLFNAVIDASGNVTDMVGTAANITPAEAAKEAAV